MASHARGTLTTHGLHSEVVYNLSASKHITEGLRRFGMGEGADAVLVCRFDATTADVSAIRAAVNGVLVDAATELEGLKDPALVKKYYRPGDLECKDGVGTVEDAIASRIGVREVM
jgi:EKC/KEOPS complex subunit CGI121/TPRKB